MSFLFSLIYLSTPIAAVIFFIVSLVLYLHKKRQFRIDPQRVDKATLSTLRFLLIASAAIVAVFAAVVIGFALLMMSAVAYM